MPDNAVVLGEMIKQARISRDLSLDELGQLCKLSSQFLEQIETGHTVPDLLQFNQILDYLGYDICYKDQTAPDLSKEERIRMQAKAIRFLSRHDYIIRGELEPAIELITEKMADVLKAEFNGAWLLNKKKDYLQNIGEYHRSRKTHDNSESYSKADYPEWFEWIENIESDRSSSAGNDTELNEEFPEFAENRDKWSIKATMETTIMSEGEVIGVISTEDIVERAWHADEIAFHHQIADIISATIRNAHYRKLRKDLEQQQERAHRQQRVLMEMMQNQDIVDGNIHAALGYICKAASELYEASGAAVWLLNDDEKTMQCLGAYNRNDEGEGFFLQGLEPFNFVGDECPIYFNALSLDRVIAVEDAKNDYRLSELLDDKFIKYGTSFLNSAVHKTGKLIGTISVHSETSRHWTADEKKTISEIAEQITQTLINSERHRLLMLSRAVEHSATAVFIADLNNNIKYSNPRFQQLIGKNETIINRMSLKHLPINSNSSEKLLELLFSIQNDKPKWQGELEFVDTQGESLWIMLTASPVFDAEGEICDYVFVCDDISELKSNIKMATAS